MFKKIKKHGIKKTLAYIAYYSIAINLPYAGRWSIIGTISNIIRRELCRILFHSCGDEFSVGKNVDFDFLGHLISVGERANIGNHAWLRGGGRLIMGNDIMMGEFALIYTQDHKAVGLGYDGYIVGDVTICDNVWIGGRVTILKGITVGKNAIIGAGSVVTKDIPENAIVAGNPAKIVKMRSVDQVPIGPAELGLTES